MAREHTTGRTGSRTSGRLPFDAAERKKIVVLVALAAVCAVVVVVQLWPKKGPAAAYGATPAQAAAALDIGLVVEQMQEASRGPVQGCEGSLFTTVDEALDLFLGGARPAAVPVEQLRTAVFGLPESLKAVAPKAKSLGVSFAGTTPEGGKNGDPVMAELAAMNLETVLLSSRNRAAIINGQVYHTGETLGGFTITDIETGCVTLLRGGKRYALRLK